MTKKISNPPPPNDPRLVPTQDGKNKGSGLPMPDHFVRPPPPPPPPPVKKD
jgi:hypothetical protein